MAASRVGYVGTESIGDVLTKANFDKLPGGQVAKASVTASSTAAGGTTTVTTITFTAGTNRRYEITIMCSSITTTGSGTSNINVYDSTGTTQLAQCVLGTNPQAAGTYGGGMCVASHEPAAGSQTYLFRQTTDATTVKVNASATAPATITVMDVGPAY